MSLRVLLDSALDDEGVKRDNNAAEVAEKAVVEILGDPALRGELFTEVFEELDDITMVEIHVVMDALVRVMKGESDG